MGQALGRGSKRHGVLRGSPVNAPVRYLARPCRIKTARLRETVGRNGQPTRRPNGHGRVTVPWDSHWDAARKYRPGRAVAYSTVTVLARLRGWSTGRPRR